MQVTILLIHDTVVINIGCMFFSDDLSRKKTKKIHHKGTRGVKINGEIKGIIKKNQLI